MNKQILFLDDDRYEMQGYVDKLRAEGFDVIYHASPDEALHFLRGKPTVDLIIVDLIMRYSPTDERDEAHLAGYHFCKTVRETMRLDCPIIVLSVVTDEEMLAPVRPLTSTILHKPILPVELLAHVKEGLS